MRCCQRKSIRLFRNCTRRTTDAVFTSRRYSCPPSLETLTAAQNYLQDSNPRTKVKDAVITAFGDFFCYPRDGVQRTSKKLADEWRTLLKETKERSEEAGRAAAMVSTGCGEETETDQKDLPVFLMAFDSTVRPSAVYLFSVSKNTLIGRYTLEEIQQDFWDHAGQILNHVPNTSRRFILLAVVENKADRKRVLTPLQLLLKALRSCGLQPHANVDTLALEELVAMKNNRTMSGNHSEGIGKAVTVTPALFTQFWSNLCASLCQMVEEDPLTAINTFVAPNFDVLVIHVVRTGSQGLSISLWSPSKKKRYTAKGMLSDVLSCLLQTGALSMILIPTGRTDRLLLYQCRTAMTKVGKNCVICFATGIHEKCKALFDSDPCKLWTSMSELYNGLESDLLFQTYECAGKVLRESFKKMWSKEGRQQYVEKHVHSDCLPTQSDVKQWQRVLQLPQRIQREAKELQKFKKFLVIAYNSTEHTAFCQPRNPSAEINYIITVCVCDHTGRLLEPWAKYSSRKSSFQFPSLDDYDVLVAYDVKRLMLLCGKSDEMEKFIKRGGRVWCIMLAEYLLSAQQCITGYNNLHEIALQYGTVLPPRNMVGVGAETLPLYFHRRHLLAAAPAIEKVFQSQLLRAQEQCQVVSLAHRMDSLLTMAHMEERGICIDSEEAARQNNSLKNSLVVMDHSLEAYTPPEVPVDLRQLFDWSSLSHLHALLFGGEIELGDSGMHRARETRTWITNLMHLLYRFSNFDRLNTETQLSRYATLCQLTSTSNAKLSVRIGRELETKEKAKEKKFRVVVFDVETTGLNAATDEIIEIALYDPVEDVSFRSLIRPNRRINPRTVGIHHITEEEVKTAPSQHVVMKGVMEFLRLETASRDPNEIIVMIGHNVFSLDEPMLRRAMDRYTGEPEIADGILFCDSLTLLRGLKISLQKKFVTKKGRPARRMDRRVLEALTTSLRLSKLIESLGIVAEGELHRAETDTRALWRVLLDTFDVSKRKPEEQRAEILSNSANSFFKFPSVGCFVPHMRMTTGAQVTLPGIVKEYISSPRTVSSLRKKSISDELLVTLHTHGIEVAGLLLKRQRLERMAPRFLDPHGGGLHSTMHPDGYIRQHIDMTHTITSRTSSGYPSCQNISKDGPTRRLFVSRFGANGRCVEVDYSQLEIVILAILSRDPKLVHDLKSGIDFHIKRAEFFSGIPYKQIEEGYKNGVAKFVKLRKMAKQFSFQRLYGAGVTLLHKTTGIAIKDLQQSIEKEEVEYPGISEFYRTVRAVALRPNNPGLPTGYIVELPTGCRIHYKTRDVVLNLPPVKNYPIQAYGAEISQIMVGHLYRHFVQKDFYKNRAFIVNFVHDSVWLDCHKDVVQECVKTTCRILSSAQEYVPKMFPGVEIEIPLKVSASSGVDMHEMNTFKF